MKRLALWAIRFYQIAVSPYLPSACRYEPTCSRYAQEAIERFGVTRGGVMAVRRILRCTPLHEGGYDPVPEKVVVSRET
jgi:putative membrane protein insertion efficiency factor